MPTIYIIVPALIVLGIALALIAAYRREVPPIGHVTHRWNIERRRWTGAVEEARDYWWAWLDEDNDGDGTTNTVCHAFTGTEIRDADERAARLMPEHAPALFSSRLNGELLWQGDRAWVRLFGDATGWHCFTYRQVKDARERARKNGEDRSAIMHGL